jgi:hypothetical protein
MPLPVVAPAVIALTAGAGVEGAYAWYDPDLFTKGIWSNYELDQRVETLNNYWQNLWRAGGSRINPTSDLGRKLDNAMAGWVDFKQRYDDAIFRRAADPFGLWGAKADFETELNDVWLKRFTDLMSAVIAADPLVRSGLEARHVDVEDYMVRSGLNPDGSTRGGNVGLYIGVALTLTLLGVGAALAYSKQPRRLYRV